MSEFSCTILCGTLRNSAIVITAINALITSLTAMETCPPCIKSHHIVTFLFQLGSVTVQRILFLRPGMKDCTCTACQDTLPLLLLPAPTTTSMDSGSIGNALLDNFTAFFQFPRDRTTVKESSRVCTAF